MKQQIISKNIEQVRIYQNKFLYMILFIFFTNGLYSQRIAVNELMSIFNFNQDEIDTYIVKKGYKFHPTVDSKNEKHKEECKFNYTYSYIKNPHYDFAIYNCIYNDNKTTISARTRSETDYLKFKDELKLKGFKYIETFDFEESKFITYELLLNKKTYEASLVSTPLRDGTTIYEISITQK
jgi:hypothetical protein